MLAALQSLGLRIGFACAVTFSLLPGRAYGKAASFRGNVALPDAVYQHVLRHVRARKVEGQASHLLRFLHNAGYELATVDVTPNGKLLIDEGKLAKIVIRGRGTVRSVQLRFQIKIPFRIFNRYQLEAQLEALEEELDTKASFRIKPASEIPTKSGRITIPLITAFDDDQNPGRNVLEILVPSGPRRGRFDLVANLGGADGFRTGVAYTSDSFLMDGDVFRVQSEFGLRSFDRLNEAGGDMRFSRARVLGRWRPRFFEGAYIEPLVTVSSDLAIRQRQQLDLERFHWWRNSAALGVSVVRSEATSFWLGAGYESRRLFRLKGSPANLENFSQSGLLAELGLERTFGAIGLRLDRNHQLKVRLEYFRESRNNSTWRLDWEYQNVWEEGWHDWWLTSRAMVGFGDIAFPLEEPLNEVTKGFFAQQFGRQVIGVSGERRWSVIRDLLKLGWFVDVGGLGRLRTGSDRLGYQVAVASGLGIHALLWDTLQADFYLGGAVLTDEGIDTAFSARINKAF